MRCKPYRTIGKAATSRPPFADYLIPSPNAMTPLLGGKAMNLKQQTETKAMRAYSYEISGTAANDQTWKIIGTVDDPNNDLPAVFDRAMRESFLALTQGKAVFGNPGVGCAGPYGISRILIEQV